MKLHLRYFFAISLAILFIARSSNPPNGKTGAPGEGTCSDCHNPSATTMGEVNIIGIPAEVDGGMSYNVTVEAKRTAGTNPQAGFQLVVLDDSDDNAGTLVEGNTNTGIDNDNGRTYFEHRSPATLDGNGEVTWTATWTAPLVPDGEKITFYAAANIVNGTGGTGSDRVVTNQFSTTLNSTLTALVLNISKDDISCNGEQDGSATANVSGGQPPYSYSWSNNQTTSKINNLTGGNYSVTVTDNGGQETSSSVTIIHPTVLSAAITDIVPVACFGESNGSTTVTPSGGTTPYSYRWTNNDDNATLTNVPTGVYAVTVTDNSGCQTNVLVNIPQHNLLKVNFTTVNSVVNKMNGSATANPSGGSGGFSYHWSNGSFTQTITGLNGGFYTVTTTDDLGCTATETVQIKEVTCDINIKMDSTVILCNGDNNGSASVTPQDGDAPYIYEWSTGDSTATIDSLPKGSYSVTVTDFRGCTASGSVQITEPEALLLSVTTTEASCFESMDGIVKLLATGGIPSYGFSFDSAPITDSIVGFNPGVYSFSVIDLNQCTDTIMVEVGILDTIPPILILDTNEIYLDSFGTATVSFSYFDNGTSDECRLDSTAISQSTFDCSHVGTVQIAFTAWDSVGNFTSDTLSINIKDTLAPIFDQYIDIISQSCDTIFYPLPTLSDNCGNFSMVQIAGIGSGNVFPVGTTKEVFRAFDLAGNITELTVNVTIDPTIKASFQTVDLSCYGDSNGFAIAIPVDSSYSINWSTGETSYSISGLKAGTYSVTAMDTFKCIIVDSVTVSQPDMISVIVDSVINSIDSIDVGKIGVSVMGGMSPYTYTWLLGGDVVFSTKEDPDSLPVGNYSLIVNDANGCIGFSDTITVGLSTSIIDEQLAEALNVFPNPASDYTEIRLLKNYSNVKVSIFNLHGKNLLTKNLQDNILRINTSSFSPGIYLVKVETRSGFATKKLLIN